MGGDLDEERQRQHHDHADVAEGAQWTRDGHGGRPLHRHDPARFGRQPTAVPAPSRHSGTSDPVLHTGGDECCGFTVWCMRVTPGSHSTTAPMSKAATTRSATSSAVCSRTLTTTSKPKLRPPDKPGVPPQRSDRKDDKDHE